MASCTVIIAGEVIGKQRPRAVRMRAGVRVYTPAKTVEAEAVVRAQVIASVGKPCFGGPLAFEARVYVPIPASWPKKRQKMAVEGSLMPTGKPDADNVLKLLCDALNGVLWADDAQLVDASLSLRYSTTPGACLTCRQVLA